MSLLELSNELLYQIFSQDDVLQPCDIYHSILTCHRLNAVALPLLYRKLRFPHSSHKQNPHVPTAVEKCNHALRLHPERTKLVQSFDLEIVHAGDKMWIRAWNNMSIILPKLSALQTLRICTVKSSVQYEFLHLWDWNSPRCLTLTNFVQIFDSPTDFASLKKVHIDDWKITAKDIVQFLSMPSIKHLKIESRPIASTLTQLEISSCSTPLGNSVGYIFKCVPELKKLNWYTCAYRDSGAPHTINEAFLPLQATLVELRLTTVIMGMTNFGLPDFSPFLALKYLRIQGEVMFTEHEFRAMYHDRSYLVNRLPRSLEHLEIVFSPGWTALVHLETDEIRDSMFCQWLLALADQRYEKVPRLSKLCIMEELLPISSIGKWDCPGHVRDALSMANIDLKVLLGESLKALFEEERFDTTYNRS
ncbi:hypothetical protein G7Y89_g14748 [Cudoniella acicularis]|uniref:Uncharacterized protein n=1 Tax=Cudoniella acicularis TaxID=354080 RepID=A0A8H4QX04_9HELO|nr:hypothetical protein G7Y89_g14748 [Cudoniella acicularis]